MSISNYLEEAWLKTIRGGGVGTTFTAVANCYIKLHVGDPGEDGTANAAGETTRKEFTGAAPANPGGTMANSGDIVWTNVSTSETYSHATLWDHLTAGNCLMVGTITPNKEVNATDTFTLPASTGAIFTLA